MLWYLTFTISIILIILFLLNFYRDPDRIIPEGDNLVSPADGRVISIIDTQKEFIKIKKGVLGKIKVLSHNIAKQCYIISIFMSPFDVHYNRAPISGTIKLVRHTKGEFFRAYDLKSFENEKNEIIIQNKKMKIKVVQIAGFLARRIKCYVKQNQKVNKGDKIGMIAFGSQVTLIIPKNSASLRIKPKEKVKSGETIIGTLKK